MLCDYYPKGSFEFTLAIATPSVSCLLLSLRNQCLLCILRPFIPFVLLSIIAE